MNSRAFTLVELLVTIGIIAVLSAIILFSISQYINKSKDAAIAGNLSVLVPAGEVYYDHNSGNGYGAGDENNPNSFCGSSTVKNSFSQISSVKHCMANVNAWSACAQEFVNKDKAFCVDSRGYKREIDNSDCDGAETACPLN